jgi:hypothetical protein
MSEGLEAGPHVIEIDVLAMFKEEDLWMNSQDGEGELVVEIVLSAGS